MDFRTDPSIQLPRSLSRVFRHIWPYWHATRLGQRTFFSSEIQLLITGAISLGFGTMRLASGTQATLASTPIKPDTFSGESIMANLTAVGIGKLGGEIRNRLPDTKILLLGLLPRHDQFSAEIPVCNKSIASMKDDHVFYFDPGAQLIPDDYADPVHLSPAGYQHLAELLKPKIEELSR